MTSLRRLLFLSLERRWLEANVHFVSNTRAFTHRSRIAQPQRRAIGLERGIAPVALIFQLEEIAAEAQFQGSKARPFDLQLREWLGQRARHAVNDRLRRY